ncbi:hypothetical protein GE061_000068 [Apolygus lucorum]|uniref:Uncharacterized protein n=1 Tax=Apolygus lucorum TaxID=248454 RepID=A0A8S9Y5X3_APOLU|nr:hypothetical protein GE061_000068 [Apolygus lucorum]
MDFAALSELMDSSSDDEALSRRDHWLSSGSSDDSLMEVLQEERVVPKNEGFFRVIENFDDELFKQHFRVSRKVAELIASDFELSAQFHHETGGNGKPSPFQQTLIFLWKDMGWTLFVAILLIILLSTVIASPDGPSISENEYLGVGGSTTTGLLALLYLLRRRRRQRVRPILKRQRVCPSISQRREHGA